MGVGFAGAKCFVAEPQVFHLPFVSFQQPATTVVEYLAFPQHERSTVATCRCASGKKYSRQCGDLFFAKKKDAVADGGKKDDDKSSFSFRSLGRWLAGCVRSRSLGRQPACVIVGLVTVIVFAGVVLTGVVPSDLTKLFATAVSSGQRPENVYAISKRTIALHKAGAKKAENTQSGEHSSSKGNCRKRPVPLAVCLLLRFCPG